MSARQIGLGSAVALIAISHCSPATAQGLLPRGEWGGSHWGIAAGGVWGSLRSSSASADLVRTGYAGYGVQLAALYLGAELDATLGGARNLSRISATTTVATEVDWSAAARARAGLAFDGLLLYVTGGAAWASQRYEGLSAISGQAAGAQIVRGVVWGAGLEMKLLPILSGRLEALHYDYASSDASLSRSLRASLANAFAKGVSTDETVVRAGLVIRWH